MIKARKKHSSFIKKLECLVFGRMVREGKLILELECFVERRWGEWAFQAEEEDRQRPWGHKPIKYSGP